MLLRKKGNYYSRSKKLLPVRRSKNTKNVLPCDNCMGFYSATYLWRHRNKCIGESRRENKSQRHQIISQNFLLKDLKVDPLLKENVFSRMLPDKVSLVAKMDSVICEYATDYFKAVKLGNPVFRTSQKMRALGKILIHANSVQPSIKNMCDLLRSNHYMIIVKAVSDISKYVVEMGNNIPIVVGNIASSLRQCCDIVIKRIANGENSSTSLPAAELQEDINKLKLLIRTNLKTDIINLARYNKDLLKTNGFKEYEEDKFLDWTTEQKNIVISYLQSEPTKVRRNDCLKIKKMYTDLLKDKSWLKIYRFARNWQFKNNIEPLVSHGTRRTFIHWSPEEKALANSFFREHIKNSIAPRKYECLKFKKMHGELLKNKDWVKIKSYVYGQYKKKDKVNIFFVYLNNIFIDC